MHLRSTRELIINITNCKGFRKLRATYHSVLSKYAETHEQCLLEALEISQEIGDKSSKAISYLKVGTVLESVGQLVKAKERYKKSLEINKEIDNKRGVAASCANLRRVLTSVGEYSKAEEYLLESLEVKQANELHTQRSGMLPQPCKIVSIGRGLIIIPGLNRILIQ